MGTGDGASENERLVFVADGHAIQAPQVIIHRFMHNAAGGEVGAGFLQRNVQLTLPQFTAHAQPHLPWLVKRLGVLPEATLLQVLVVLQEMFAPS